MFWTGRDDCYIRASVAIEGRQSRERYTFPTEAYTARWFPKIWELAALHPFTVGSFSHRSHFLARLARSRYRRKCLCDVFSTVSAFCSSRLHETNRMDGQTKWPPTEARKTKKSKKAKARKQEAKQSKCPPPTSKGSAEAHSTIAKSQR